ncbi:tetratricopeptide repeat protein [Ectothiorhodospira shaposhnikovii]|uniref:tetratricopeptide repeat protein n=1 Tax=Ectothiorhodospira shaposhnikovii TaxID=1054 RepID=UPI001EE92835|nr:hypothetical protein [Ectothiorhodospira shaposhnikovii]MCG5512089.1 hypothetical protein [Ectothiorhodospira shaposhnikovii]
MLRTIALFIFLLPFPFIVNANQFVGGELECGSLKNPDGPNDYRRADFSKGIPQGDNHFTPEIERLERGRTSILLGDIDYTLRSWPNHHRALWAVSRYERLNNGRLPNADQLRGWRRSADCYFDRAMRFTPDDGTVRMLYGMHLHLSGHPRRALPHFEKAAELGEDSAEFHYNFGLLLFDLRDYRAAREQAEKAYSLGHPLPGLRNRLQRAGHWN